MPKVLVPWNKGLTRDMDKRLIKDPRVGKKQGKFMRKWWKSLSAKERKKLSEKRTRLWKEAYWASPEMQQARSERKTYWETKSKKELDKVRAKKSRGMKAQWKAMSKKEKRRRSIRKSEILKERWRSNSAYRQLMIRVGRKTGMANIGRKNPKSEELCKLSSKRLHEYWEREKD